MSAASRTLPNVQRLWRRLAASTFLAAPGFALAGAASAQTIDYIALEQLFQEPVTASATGQPQRASEAPANMIIVTAYEIRRSGARKVEDVLRNVRGVDVLDWTNGHTEIALRGYNKAYNSRLLVLVDGRQVYADHYGLMPWSTLPIEIDAIQQIEIITGPNSALFGFNAVGGVINIITKDPATAKVNVVTASAGTQDEVGVSAVTSFDLTDWLSARLSAAVTQHNDFDTPIPPGYLGQRADKFERVAYAADVVAELSDRTRLRFEAGKTQVDRTDIPPEIDVTPIAVDVQHARITLQNEGPLGLVEATLYQNVLTNSADIPALGSSFYYKNRVTVGRLQDVIPVGANHTLRGTLEWRRSSLNTSPLEGGEIQYDVASLGAMWNWKLTPQLALTNAIRVDRLALERSGVIPPGFPFSNSDWDRDIEETTFNSGLVWIPASSDTVRVLAGRGVQLPNLIALGGSLEVAAAGAYTGNPNLPPTKTTDFQIDWKHHFTSGVETRFNVFWQSNEDFVDIGGAVDFSGGVPFVMPSARGDSTASGVEAGLGIVGDEGWRWDLNYRFERVDDEFVAPAVPIGLGLDFEYSTPEHLATARLGRTDGRWEWDVFLRYQSDTQSARPDIYTFDLQPVDAHANLNGRIAYSLTDNLILSVSGQNLLTEAQRQTSGPDVGRRVLGTLSFSY